MVEKFMVEKSRLGVGKSGLRSLGLKSSWLKSLGLETSWLKSPGLKSLGLKSLWLKLGVEKSRVEMYFNPLSKDLRVCAPAAPVLTHSLDISKHRPTDSKCRRDKPRSDIP